MSISIIDGGGFLNEKLRRMVRRRLLYALSRFDSRISKAELLVAGDSISPSPGDPPAAWKECRVSVIFGRGEILQVTDRDDDLAKCIARVAERAGREVARVVEQTHPFDRSRTTN